MSERSWKEFVGAQDLVWRRPPTRYGQAPFLGDGRVVHAEGNVVRFIVQRADVQDHRDTGGSRFGVCRLPVGNLKIAAAGVITFAACVHSERSVFSLDFSASGTERPAIEFVPALAIPPRADFNPLPDGYVLNPDPVTAVSPVRYRDRGDGTLEIPLRRGQEVLVHPKGRRPDLAVRPIAITTPGRPWGLPA
ncbi:hypothetical protein ACFWNN_32235 [Lentzea sp. NPDC058450]|uniref:hypothetical protein n=1 Tax=Lentzea sp. NPDC058450 TaxID=3346505 RepID=UPI00364B833A